MTVIKHQKHHSRLLNLLLMAALLWSAFALSAVSTLPPVFKMFAAYVSWGIMIYLLMGFFFARKPSGTIAVLGGVGALGAELGRFDLTSLVASSSEMPVFMAGIMVISLMCYAMGIGLGWVIENLMKALWKQVKPKLVLNRVEI